MYLTHKDLSKYWVLDIETDGLDPTRIWCIVAKNIGSGEYVTFTEKAAHGGTDISLFHDWISGLDSSHKVVGHNIISFDVPAINKLLGCSISLNSLVDTLVLSYLYCPNMENGHSLKAWGERFRFPKGDYDDWSQLTPEMIKYCKQDVDITERVFLGLTNRMKKFGYSEKSCELEHEIRYVINKQQRNGFYFDKGKAESLLLHLRAEQSRLERDIYKLFPPTLVETARIKRRFTKDGVPFKGTEKFIGKHESVEFEDDWVVGYDYVPFNLGSPLQRKEKLLSLGWKPKYFTPKGNPKVDEDSLIEFAESSGIPEVRAIAEWLVVTGRANMVNTWLQYVQPDSRIHGRVLTCGASTRRFTHNSPNTANIPKASAKVPYGKECRELWMATPGRVLVGYDAAGLEMRMFLHALGAPAELVKLYLEGDPHQANADALTEALRPFMGTSWAGVDRNGPPGAKTAFYAFLYGAQDLKLGSSVVVNGTKEMGAVARETLFRNTPGLKELVTEIKREHKVNKGRIKLIDGGHSRCPSPHAALNYLCQGNGALVMKQTAVFIDKRARHLDHLKVGDIHDEGQHDVLPEHAEEFGKIAVQAIRDTGKELGFLLPLDGDYKIGKSWAETH